MVPATPLSYGNNEGAALAPPAPGGEPKMAVAGMSLLLIPKGVPSLARELLQSKQGNKDRYQWEDWMQMGSQQKDMNIHFLFYLGPP